MNQETRILLLVEDNPGDAELVRDLLGQDGAGRFHVLHVPRLDEALAALQARNVDVVVLDLSLPDCSGLDTVRAVRSAAGQVPIVVLTGNEDERLALACIDAGAQDYLPKAEVGSRHLLRAIGYAITRVREAQLHDLQESLARYRALSSANQRTTVTAALAGSGAIRERSAADFSTVVEEYYGLLQPYLSRKSDRVEAPRDAMEQIVTRLGDWGAGPRDLLDAHLSAIDRALASHANDPHARSIVYEARLLALEMMGLLVDYYRVGYRRRFALGGNA